MKSNPMSLIGSAALLALALALAPDARAVPVTFFAHLDGASENPANASPATGEAEVIFDTGVHTMRVIVTFSDLLGTTTASHIHCCVAPPGNVSVATQTPTFTGFPLGVTSGSYDHSFDMTLASSYNAPFLAANGGTAASAEAALFDGMSDGMAYLNIHTSLFVSGEIRGFLVADVPEPATAAVFGLGLAGLLLVRRRVRLPRA